MSDFDVADLTAATTLAAADLLYAATSGGTVDRKITADNAASALAGLAGWTLIDADEVSVTSGDISLTATAITDISAAAITLQGAVTGDKVYYDPLMSVSNIAQDVGFDVYTWVSSARVNPFGAGLSASLGTTGGVWGWYKAASAVILNVVGRASRTLVSGDISGGNVELRLHYAKSTSTARTLYANTNNILKVQAQLWRPPT